MPKDCLCGATPAGWPRFPGGAAAEISDGAMFDLAVFAIGLPQQITGVGFAALANVGDVDIHGGYESM